MLTSSVIEGTNIVTLSIDGDVAADDIVTVRESLEGVLASHQKANLLVEFRNLGDVGPEAVWQDLKSAGILDDLERFAVVTDEGWVQRLADLLGALPSLDTKVFGEGQRDEALVWLERTSHP